MANNPIGDRARLIINSSTARNKQLRKVKSCKESDDRDAEHVFNVSDDAPAGVRRKPGGGSLELEGYEEKGTPEVDYQALQDSGEFFSFTREIVGGRRVQYLDCVVANFSADDDDQGGHTFTVKILWGRRRPL